MENEEGEIFKFFDGDCNLMVDSKYDHLLEVRRMTTSSSTSQRIKKAKPHKKSLTSTISTILIE